MRNHILLFLLLLLFTTSCQKNSCLLEPEICYLPPKEFVETRPSAFPPLTPEERQYEWARELVIAQNFAKEADFYRTITSFKRAFFLTPKRFNARRLEMHYGVIQSYYLAGKFQDTVESFEASPLVDCPPDFPALDDLLIMLYDSYKRVGNDAKANAIYSIIEVRNPLIASEIQVSETIRSGDFCIALAKAVSNPEYDDIYTFTEWYRNEAKSPRKAQFLNAILPGAGYLYIGQKQSALTSFWLNALFISAAYYFFDHNNIPAGLILTSFEFGWYFGGINGAGLGAKEYNAHLYNTAGKELLIRNSLFPVLMLKYTF